MKLRIQSLVDDVVDTAADVAELYLLINIIWPFNYLVDDVVDTTADVAELYLLINIIWPFNYLVDDVVDTAADVAELDLLIDIIWPARGNPTIYSRFKINYLFLKVVENYFSRIE